MYDQQLSYIISQAVDRLQSKLNQSEPVTGAYISQWMRHLSGSEHPEDYFKHPAAFPILLLPWWAETALGQKPDSAFQADLVYSTMNGYYYIRLIDNMMDGHATAELKYLPVVGFFHTQFQMVYQRYFLYDHPFWEFFSQVWLHSAEITIQDTELLGMDETQFKQIAAQKTCAVKIPLAAVCYRHNRPDMLRPWSQFVELFGCWHQLFNDLFDWHRDHPRQNRTFFLSEAERRRAQDESVAGWVAREGFAWAVKKLQTWMSDLRARADHLNSPELITYLNTREMMLLKQKTDVTPGLQALAKIVAAGNK